MRRGKSASDFPAGTNRAADFVISALYAGGQSHATQLAKLALRGICASVLIMATAVMPEECRCCLEPITGQLHTAMGKTLDVQRPRWFPAVPATPQYLCKVRRSPSPKEIQ